eukprot:12599086-Alexandrium_andersonii.AAC.1
MGPRAPEGRQRRGGPLGIAGGRVLRAAVGWPSGARAIGGAGAQRGGDRKWLGDRGRRNGARGRFGGV